MTNHKSLISQKDIAWGQKRWKIMNYDVFSILGFLIIFIISLIAYSNEFAQNHFFGNETFEISDPTASMTNFTLKKWNCQHPLGKFSFRIFLGLIPSWWLRDVALDQTAPINQRMSSKYHLPIVKKSASFIKRLRASLNVC